MLLEKATITNVVSTSLSKGMTHHVQMFEGALWKVQLFADKSTIFTIMLSTLKSLLSLDNIFMYMIDDL